MALSVTAAQSGAGATENGIALTVKVVTGQAASPAGASAASSSVTVPELPITPSGSGSLVYGAVVNVASSATFTAASGTTFTQNVAVSSYAMAVGTFRSSGTTTAGTPVTLGASAPSEASGTLVIALLEILKGSGTLAEDSSSPAPVSSGSATTVTTAAFTPPPGSLLVASVASNGSGATNDSMTMTVSDSSGLTWTRRVTGSLASGSGTYQLATIWTALVPAGKTGLLAVSII